jgi:hypothetical protein
MSNLANIKPNLFAALHQRIEQYLEKVARDFDRKSLNPPRELCIHPPDIPDEWISVGYIPTPKTRLGWFTYHMIHGLAMRYPLRSVIAFSLLHTNPYGEEVVNDHKKSDQAEATGSLAG